MKNSMREGFELIEVKGLVKRYGAAAALRGVSLRVNAGEVCALIGAQGAGKTTLMDMLAGVMECDAGEISVCGCSLQDRPYEAKRHIGYVPAEPPLFKDMTPRLALRFVAEAWGMSLREASGKIDGILKETQLLEVSDTPARNLTGSARRMLSLAQALLMDPEVLLIDEPTEGLDVKDALCVRRVITGLAGGKTVLLATKNLTEVQALCSRVLALVEGRICADLPMEHLHALELDTNRLEMCVKGGEASASQAAASVKGARVVSCEQAGEPDAVRLTVEMDGDLRAALSTAMAKAELPLLEMKKQTLSGEALLEKLTSERVCGKGEDSGDESDL